MLLSHEHKFIFIKNKKVAGTSLEILLSQFLHAPDDIITPISRSDEMLRSVLKVFPRNFGSRAGCRRFRRRRHNPSVFWNHMSATRIRERLPSSVWKNYIKITSERHPYEKAVSLAWHRSRTTAEFRWQLDHVIEQGRYRNIGRYSIDGKVVADIVIRYEALLEDTNVLLETLGLPQVSHLPRAKVQYRRDPRPASEVLSAVQKRHIQRICDAEFNLFGYDK